MLNPWIPGRMAPVTRERGGEVFDPDDVRWYVMHEHGDGQGRHGHSTAQNHMGDVNNPRANDHTGVETVATLEEAQKVWGRR